MVPVTPLPSLSFGFIGSLNYEPVEEMLFITNRQFSTLLGLKII
jgi:hypothetical protein